MRPIPDRCRAPLLALTLFPFLLWTLTAQAQPIARTQGDSVASETLVSMDFRNVEIKDVLRLLAKQYNLNIIISQDVKGPVAVRFTDVTIDEALEAIITVNGYAYTRMGRVIKVTMPVPVEEAGTQIQVFQLRYADATKLMVPLRTVLSSRGTMDADGRSNTLVVSDSPPVLQTLGQVIAALDEPTQQILIETKLIETVLSDEERLGISWDLAASLQGGAQPITFPFPQRGIQRARKFLPLGQTASESTTTVTEGGGATTATATDFPAGEGGFGFPFADQGLFTFGTLNFSQFRVFLQALESRAKTKALAAPSITTLDNQEAQIVVGTNVPIPTFARNKETGGFEITGYTDKKTGVVLTVTPHLTKDGEILLDIHPEVSSITRYVGDPQAQVPVTSTREANTRVSLQSGETVVIGGLMNEREVETKRGVPGLSRIPYLGRLFRFNETTTERTDLLIFITARVLNEEMRMARTLEAVAASGQSKLFGPGLREGSGKAPAAAEGSGTRRLGAPETPAVPHVELDLSESGSIKFQGRKIAIPQEEPHGS